MSLDDVDPYDPADEMSAMDDDAWNDDVRAVLVSLIRQGRESDLMYHTKRAMVSADIIDQERKARRVRNLDG